MTAGPQTVIDRVTLIVSDLDRAEEDYVRTFGCCVEQRSDIERSLTGVLCIHQPERAGDEQALTALDAVVGLGCRIAPDQAAVAELAADRGDGAQYPRVGGG